ncbi:MAG TPA: glucose-6-phosphate isomerase [Candidatus Brocadiia bacterium]|nr:glucose-6-phosphate isomerase [Candidatus Brocadiales bacterium]
MNINFTNMMAEIISEEHGITEKELDAIANLTKQHAQELKEERRQGKLPFLDLPYQKETVENIIKVANSLKNEFKNFVVLGIGGSALGNIALHCALNHPYHNALSPAERNHCPRIFVMDNIDPDRFKGFLDIINIEETVFNVISKSGTTVETMAQYLIIKDMLKRRVGQRWVNHIIATIDASKGVLREIANREGFMSFIIPDGVGGRFSVLSPVGLLSAAVSGIDIKSLLSGAASMDKICQTDDIYKNPALMTAALHYISNKKKGKNIIVMMSYSHALSSMGDWFCQLWAESLGKQYNLADEAVYTGSTPVKAVGVTDQHSQLQLYMEGPFDKVIVFLATKKFNQTITIPPTRPSPSMREGKGEGVELEYLGGHTLNDLMKAEMLGTKLALAKNNRPNYTVTLTEITPFTIGQLLYMLELQTAYAGRLYNVNTFDQPGVEDGKINAFAILGRKGFEQRRREIESRIKAEKYRIDA